ncbi:MAG TPA: glycosyltransferase family 4 protein [Sphingomicrobium sp.]|nr:glycosyltransferase family 4 protein [Sphingomicrobium sp.]
MTGAKPVICIVDGSADVSGAFVAARREASLLGDVAEFVLLMSDKSRIPEDQLRSFARVYRLPIVSLRRSAWSALAYIPALLRCSLEIHRILRRERCGRLQFNDFHFAHGAVLRALGYRGRIVTWVRLDPRMFGKIGALWLALARRSSDRLVAVSEFIRRRVGLPGTEILFDPTPDVPVLGVSTAEPVLVFMGSYQRVKGQDAAIEAFDRIARRHGDARLAFYGSDMGLPGSIAFLDRLRDRARRGDGAGRIEFRPAVGDPAEVLKLARAALCLSRTEPFGLVCQEASACGIPVIATRSGGPEEIIEDGVSGYLVDVDDVAAIAARMDELLSDAALARKLGLAGAELVRTRFPAADYKAAFRNVFDL